MVEITGGDGGSKKNVQSCYFLQIIKVSAQWLLMLNFQRLIFIFCPSVVLHSQSFNFSTKFCWKSRNSSKWQNMSFLLKMTCLLEPESYPVHQHTHCWNKRGWCFSPVGSPKRYQAGHCLALEGGQNSQLQLRNFLVFRYYCWTMPRSQLWCLEITCNKIINIPSEMGNPLPLNEKGHTYSR